MKRGNKKGQSKRIASLSPVAHLRMRAGLTQEALAMLLGVTRVTVFNWEHRGCPESKLARVRSVLFPDGEAIKAAGELETEKCSRCHVDTWRQAMAYQASLTKAGEPRNR